MPEETFGNEGVVQEVVFHEGDDVAAIAVFHPVFELGERVVEVEEFGQVVVDVAEDIADDVDFCGDVANVFDDGAGGFEHEKLTGFLVFAEFDFAETAFADVFDPPEIFFEVGFFDFVFPVGFDASA